MVVEEMGGDARRAPARRVPAPLRPCSDSRCASASLDVTGPAAASERTDGARRFASCDSHGKFVSLIAARISA